MDTEIKILNEEEKKKMRAFVKACLLEGTTEKEIDDFIKADRWLEFPARSIIEILDNYELEVNSIRKNCPHSRLSADGTYCYDCKRVVRFTHH